MKVTKLIIENLSLMNSINFENLLITISLILQPAKSRRYYPELQCYNQSIINNEFFTQD